MASVWHTFVMAGWTAYVCLLLGIIGIPFSLLAITLTIARVRAARRDLPTWSRERAFDWWQEHLPELAKAKTQLRL